MASNKEKSRFKITRKYSAEPMSKAEWENLEDLLARLIAQAYAADHPELFVIDTEYPESEQNNNLDKQGDDNDKTVNITGIEESEAA